MENLVFDSTLVSPSYRLCYVEQCPLRDTCMRYWTCQQLSDQVTTHPCVLPSAISGGRTCVHYREKRVMRGAWGFSRLFADVKRKDDARIRAEIKAYLGGNGTYYRYHHGEQLLNESQQQHVKDIFIRYGYTEDLEFDGYRMAYEF